MKTEMVSEAAKLLKNEFAERKARNESYSLRAFAKSLSMSPAQLSQLLSGKRNFTPEMVSQISKALHLSPDEERSLVTHLFLGKTEQGRQEKQKRQLAEDEFRLIADWYHFAILSLAKVRGAKADPFWISDRLGISPSEAREAMERLQRLQILDKSKNLKQISEPLNIVSEVPSRAIQAYHHRMLGLAVDRLDTPVEKRDYSAMTFAADPEKIPEARKMIEKFQDHLVDVLQTPNAKEVFAINCQLFSLERIKS